MPIVQEPIKIKAQAGPQRRFLSSSADIAIFGGAAGPGKTWALLAEPLRWIKLPNFRGIIFRRTMPQIRAPGALWNTSEDLYPMAGGTGSEHTLRWTFPSGATIQFSHMEHAKDRYSWKGAQIPYVAFDELSDFDERQFWYMLSRIRSTSGVRGYLRGASNPEPDQWLARFISWWWDQDTGYAIPERSGVIRWMARDGDTIIWGDKRENLPAELDPKSVTFIPGLLSDNQILMRKDPGYMSNLLALPLVEREQLLKGNWKIRPKAGLYFQKVWFKEIERGHMPLHNRTIRCWDRAATEADDTNDPDWTVGIKVSRDQSNVYYVEDVQRFRGSPATVEKAIQNIASQDGPQVEVVLSQDPGAAGKAEVKYHVKNLGQFQVSTEIETGDKVQRAGAASAQVEHGNVRVIKAAWNQVFYDELESFPTKGVHDDQVDAFSLAINRFNNAAAKPIPVQGGDKYQDAMDRRRERSLDG